MTPELLIPYDHLRSTFQRILLLHRFPEPRADLIATLFADASRDGVPSHGLNRFPQFIASVQNKEVDPLAQPEIVSSFGALQRLHGRSGAGPSNAHFAMSRACDLAASHGIACVALSHTNHWMRAGNYGWLAADRNCIAICFTNGTPVMAAFGSHSRKMGNNPLVLAVPRPNGRHVVVDTALSQYSWGRLKILRRANQLADLPAGYTPTGQLTNDPAPIIDGGATLPIGHWKGSGLALLLDMIAAFLANGLATWQVAQLPSAPFDHLISQTFIAIDPRTLGPLPDPIIDGILADLLATPPTNPDHPLRYPGQQTLATRAHNLEHGVPVDPTLWQQTLALLPNP